MSLAQTVQVAEKDRDHAERVVTKDDLRGAGVPMRYPEATPFDLSTVEESYSFPRFVQAVAEREELEADATEARLLDRQDLLDDPEYGADYGLLLVWPDETTMFVGSDPTASGPPWFAYTIRATEPVPAPETAQDALDRLKPPAVRDVVEEEGFVPQRHGEWWLRPTPLAPAGTTFEPGVASKPFGPSPLGNHVPREWGMSVTDDAFVQSAHHADVGVPDSAKTPPEIVEWAVRQIRKDELAWHDVREWADDILVRGTVRHRQHDHPVEKLGDDWHTAETHDFEVYTADDITGVHLDYHGA